MEKTDELLLQKARSIPAVISDGYRLYTGNFKRLFRASWMVALLYAFCFAMMMSTLIGDVLSIVVTASTFGLQVLQEEGLTFTYLKAAGSVLLFCVVMLALASYAFGACAEHRQTGQISRPTRWWGTFYLKPFLRLLVAALWMSLVWLVVAVIFGGIIYGVVSAGIVDSLWKSVATIGLLIILACVAGAFLLPLAYPVTRFVVGGTLSWRPPFGGYGLGLHHWSLLFVMLLVTAIVTCLLTFICELPAFVIGTANAKAYVGEAMGDPLGLPENMALMAFVAFLVAGFVQAYVHLYSIFPLYYAYGSIDYEKDSVY
ncbi:MAG: hypothetical protein IJ544_05125 [Prevotella sp.]|nr:hypothetical protein [Prevotella sp.]